MRKLYLKKRILTGLVAVAVTFSSLMGNVVAVCAAQNNVQTASDDSVVKITSSAYTNAAAVDNSEIAKQAYNEYVAAVKSGSADRLSTALSKLSKLSPTQRVHFFLYLYKDYYKKHFLDPGFKYFDVNKYIETYPEKAAKYPELSGDALLNAVLDDYLNEGIFEGKSSCTDFDPVIAILAHPEETLTAMATGVSNPATGLSALFTAYTVAEGSPSTRQYKMTSDMLQDRLGIPEGSPDSYSNISLVKETSPAASSQEVTNAVTSTVTELVDADNNPAQRWNIIPVVTPGNNQNQSSHNNNPNPNPSNPEPSGSEDPDPEENVPEYSPANSRSAFGVEAYSLYSRSGETVSGSPQKYLVSSTVVGSNKNSEETGATQNKTISGWFDESVYQSILNSKTAGTKAKNTVILYLYGTDLESNSGTVTSSIGELLSTGYSIDDMNIIVCTGATTNYTNSYLNETSGNCGLSIYYVDPSSLTAQQKQDATNLEKLSDTGIINSTTLKLLSNYGSSDMGDSSLLAGLVDLATDLFPASNYSIIFNDHGAGINGGIGSAPEGSNQTEISVDEIEEGLANSKLYKSGQQMSVIGFDACLMGGFEVAYNVSQYGKYMVGCEEVEVGSWNYVEVVNAFNDNTTAKEIAVQIAKYNNDKYSEHPADSGVIQAFCVYDLSQVEGTYNNLRSVGSTFSSLYNYTPATVNATDEEKQAIINEIQRDMYYAMRSVRARCYSDGGNDKENLFEYVDIYDYMSNLKVAISTVKDKWEAKNNSESSTISLYTSSMMGAIDNLLSSSSLLYEGIRYNGEQVYKVDGNGSVMSYVSMASQNSATANFWNALKGTCMAGTSIYMPYYSASTEDDGRYNDYIKQNLINEYTQMVKAYVEYTQSSENKARIDRLKNALATNDGYESLFGQASIRTVKSNAMDTSDALVNDKPLTYINVPINTEYTQAVKEAVGEDSIDPFTDFTEVLDKTKLYVIRNQEIDVQVTEEVGGVPTTRTVKQNVDLVIGQITVSDASTVGAKESINIVLADIKGYRVYGDKYGSDPDQNYYTEYALATSISGYEESIKNALGLQAEEDVSKWVLFAGHAIVGDEGNTENDSKELTYNIYSKNDGGDTYTYKGSIKCNSEGNIELDNGSLSLYTNVKGISFNQYVSSTDDGYVYSEDADKMGYTYTVTTTDSPFISLESIASNESSYNKYMVEVDLNLNETRTDEVTGEEVYDAKQYQYHSDVVSETVKTNASTFDTSEKDDDDGTQSQGGEVNRNSQSRKAQSQSTTEDENLQDATSPVEEASDENQIVDSASEAIEEASEASEDVQTSEETQAVEELSSNDSEASDEQAENQNHADENAGNVVDFPVEAALPVDMAGQTDSQAPYTTGEGQSSDNNSDSNSGDNAGASDAAGSASGSDEAA